jgi:hypothetical protein
MYVSLPFLLSSPPTSDPPTFLLPSPPPPPPLLLRLPPPSPTHVALPTAGEQLNHALSNRGSFSYVTMLQTTLSNLATSHYPAKLYS